MTTTTFTVAGMTCGHCEMSVTEEVEKIIGVSDVRVSADTGVLSVTSAEPLADTEVIEAVREAGYTAVRV
ncbi:heavy-metal-associated domain-containing protein [Klugiella xanthotipulae]|uniref:Copper chaperone CopZ n=1 Tax=Klugiella xanthotipulae TaxID=244735 RepID=A0A543I3V0_9MICO|nr:heavy-metal-associated domain-containing protein [Klugiella xanthotipulae]TQM65272.1 copper chaperone CopZ [Klugiella xanthotipulae]